MCGSCVNSGIHPNRYGHHAPQISGKFYNTKKYFLKHIFLNIFFIFEKYILFFFFKNNLNENYLLYIYLIFFFFFIKITFIQNIQFEIAIYNNIKKIFYFFKSVGFVEKYLFFLFFFFCKNCKNFQFRFAVCAVLLG